MPMRVCIKCNKMFNKKSGYDDHLKRKESCNPEYDRVMKIYYDKYMKEKEEKKEEKEEKKDEKIEKIIPIPL